ncbi:hypothetical protein FBU59_004406, partial [Linderina macrospora]
MQMPFAGFTLHTRYSSLRFGISDIHPIETQQKPGGKPNPIENVLKAHNPLMPIRENMPNGAKSDPAVRVSGAEHSVSAVPSWDTSATLVSQPDMLDMAVSVALDSSLCSPIHSQDTPALTYSTQLHAPLVTAAAIATSMSMGMQANGSDSTLLFSPELFPIVGSAAMSQMGIPASGNASPNCFSSLMSKQNS